jgi:formate hydrogenlyase subunit 4
MDSVVLLLTAILLSPLYSAVISKTKAFFGGRKGPPLLINYYTLIKLFRKGSVYSRSTTFVFKLSPVIYAGVGITALLLFPLAGLPSLVFFHGDVIVLFYLFGLARFFIISAALDTASPFEGMGASREAYFSVFSEITLFMTLILFYLLTAEISLSSFFIETRITELWKAAGPPLLFVVISLFMVLLAENARVPVDDPATHLELTMIHEVMVLDHSGPDLALIHLGMYLKLMFYASMITRLIFPFDLNSTALNILAFFLVLFVVYLAIGIIESTTARYKLSVVPRFLLISFAIALFAAIITLEFRS